jgi:hypothetical protein
LPKELVKEIDKRVGERHRSEYIATVLEKELRHEQLKEAFDQFAGSISHGVVPVWVTPESTVEWVRKQREEGWPDPWRNE